MSWKLKSIVVFIRVLSNLIILRNFGYIYIYLYVYLYAYILRTHAIFYNNKVYKNIQAQIHCNLRIIKEKCKAEASSKPCIFEFSSRGAVCR